MVFFLVLASLGAFWGLLKVYDCFLDYYVKKVVVSLAIFGDVYPKGA